MELKKIVLFVLFLTIGFLIVQSCKKEEECKQQTWYQDSDGDGFGNPSISKQACTQPTGFVSDNSDFNDNDANSYIGAKEICDDGIDNDGDGLTDCNDPDCNSNCANIEICDDGIDNDADGLTDCADPDCDGKSGC